VPFPGNFLLILLILLLPMRHPVLHGRHYILYKHRILVSA